MSGESADGDFTDSLVNPFRTHERVPIYYDQADTDTIGELLVYIEHEGIQNPYTFLDDEGVENVFVRKNVGLFGVQIFANETLVSVPDLIPMESRGKLNYLRWNDDAFSELLSETSVTPITRGTLTQEYRIVGGRLHFTSKSALTSSRA